ncbi:MAG TPA: thiamine-phosphate kinase [Actinomycetota bacterium]
MDVSEQELLAAIHRVLSGAGPGVIVGVGDDAAVVAPGSGELVLTTDALVEGSHFSRSTASARDIGYKAIVVNVSDIAAMAASPRFALCALTLSDAVDVAWVMELFGGMREACDEHALSLVGGNLARGPEVTVAVTVTGEVAPGRAVTRAGARPGDVLVVTGSLGAAAAGLRLSSGRTPPSDEERAAILRHLRPTARVGEAGVLARCGATAMIDVSDGLTLDLSRLCAASGVGARVRVADVPIGPAAGLHEALGGGEDYELVATLPDAARAGAAREELDEAFGVGLAEIGAIVSEPGLLAVDATGAEVRLTPAGWDHFA